MADRPCCPRCGRLFAVIDSRTDGDLRVQRFGCRPCGVYSGGVNLLAAGLPRSRIVRALVDSIKKERN